MQRPDAPRRAIRPPLSRDTLASVNRPVPLLSLQEALAPHSTCFGCGPANPAGLHLRSHERGGEVVAEWRPEPRYEAFPGALNGGIIGTLLDCHSNWAAATALMRAAGADAVPATVTASYEVRLLRPTPTDAPVTLRARVIDLGTGRATVESDLEAGGRRCATFRGTFVAVGPGHPAYHRWE
jgi:acyl-coenzyme A thioesterase PaaI-like protein